MPSTPSTPLPDSSIPSGSLTVTQLVFVGNTVFSVEELGKITVSSTDIPLASVTPEKPLSLSFTQLLQVATQVAEYYAQ